MKPGKEINVTELSLYDYVMINAERGACTCGKCADAPKNPEEKQPIGHTINLTFFKVAAKGGTKDELLALVRHEYPEWLDGKEHSYIHIGGDMGDQGIALMTIGLGHVLGAWKALSPDILMPFLPEEMKQQMAGQGMVSLQFTEEAPAQTAALVLTREDLEHIEKESAQIDYNKLLTRLPKTKAWIESKRKKEARE